MAALGTAMQGAQLGGKFGGAWGAAGGAVLGFLAGGKAQKRQDEAIKQYNNQVVKYAAQDLFDLKRQQNVENIRTSQALSTYQDNKKVQNSAITAAMGAADIIGSSAQALKQTLDFQTQQAQAETMLNWETGIENYNTTIDSAQNARSATLTRNVEGRGQEDFGALISGAVDVYGSVKGGGALTKEDFTKAGDYVSAKSTSLMGQLSSLWGSTPSSGVAASTLSSISPDKQGQYAPSTFKTFKY